jgi:hypothetical protein
MVKKSSSIAAVREKSRVHARQASATPRTQKTSAAPVGRKTELHAREKSAPKRVLRPNATIEKDFVFYANPMLALVCVPSGASPHFSIEDASHLTGVHAELLRYYSRVGLIESHRGFLETDLFFDEDALRDIKRIDHYRQHLGIGLRALPLICELRRASDRLQIELRFLNAP